MDGSFKATATSWHIRAAVVLTWPCSSMPQGFLNACRVVQNENGTVTATYTFGNEYAAALRPVVLNGTLHAGMTVVYSTC